jgi:hypothetical protein
MAPGRIYDVKPNGLITVSLLLTKFSADSLRIGSIVVKTLLHPERRITVSIAAALY